MPRIGCNVCQNNCCAAKKFVRTEKPMLNKISCTQLFNRHKEKTNQINLYILKLESISRVLSAFIIFNTQTCVNHVAIM